MRVTEHAKANHTLVDAFTIPEERLLARNLINRTVDVEVPSSLNVNDETQVHFVNSRDRGQLKICKALGPGSDALSGRSFYFEIRPTGLDLNSLTPGVSVTALAGSTQCTIAGDFPVGNEFIVSEPNPGDHVVVTGGGPITIAPGINTVMFTNTAQGKLEICKLAVPGLRGTQPTFRFKVDNGGYISIRAGTCRPPMLVSVGNHTITEALDPSYELDPTAPGGGINVVPPHRLVSKDLPGRTVTVSVPWAGNPADPGETRVDFYNRIRRGQVKICKEVAVGSLDMLGMTNFTFTYSVNGSLPAPVGTAIRNGECTMIMDGSSPAEFPILQPNGAPTNVVIDEDQAFNGSGIGVSFLYQGSGGLSSENPCSGTVTIDPLGPGMNHVTFINRKDETACNGE